MMLGIEVLYSYDIFFNFTLMIIHHKVPVDTLFKGLSILSIEKNDKLEMCLSVLQKQGIKRIWTNWKFQNVTFLGRTRSSQRKQTQRGRG